MMMPLLTLFSAPKPFTDPRIATIQRNALASWRALGPEVEVVLLGEEEGMEDVAKQFGFRHFPHVRRNTQGTPLISSMLEMARSANSSPLLACVNADIILLPDFLESARTVCQQKKEFLLVGRRWDLDVPDLLDFSGDWQGQLNERINKAGRRHARTGSDYFIFPRVCFASLPEFAIGRAGWDNWMIYEARRRHWACIDASDSICIVHQDHDYNHLPGGKTHHKLPETFENVRLAGGKRTIFTLMDTNYRLVNGAVLPREKSWAKVAREVEIFPLVSLHSYALGQVFFTVFHPLRAYSEFRAWQNQQR